MDNSDSGASLPGDHVDDEIGSHDNWKHDTFPDPDVFAGPSSAQYLTGVEDIYERLEKDCIRLLRVLPGSFDSEVRCEIESHPLSDSLQYTALSYRWGSPPDTCTILLNGHRVRVRKNPWRFLHHARNLVPQNLGLLWIDALCINQKDLQERAQQVSIMPHIYKSALKVIV